MKSIGVITGKSIPRRMFLRGTGVAMALPLLDAMTPALAAAPTPPRRMINVMSYFSFHAPYMFPVDGGPDYTPSPYLELLAEHRKDFSLISGLNHPLVRDQHNSAKSFFTGAPHPSSPSFRNTISMDLLAAEHVGNQTRYPFINFSTSGAYTTSYTASGVGIPPENSPAAVFAKLFIDGTPDQIQQETARIRAGRSILDRLTLQTEAFKRSLGASDRDKLDQYFNGVREFEQRMAVAEQWAKEPKPDPGVPAIQDAPYDQQTASLGLMLDVARLAIAADLTRIVSIYFVGTAKTPSRPGETFPYHDLSHHGQDPGKIEKLAILERDLLKEWGRSIAELKTPTEAGERLLDNTMTLFGCPLGNASSHDATNLPIMLAGGHFKHGKHIAHDKDNPPPLCNLWIQMLDQMGVHVEKFGTSKGRDIAGLDVA